ncbi:MAG: hypothetical protein CMG74_13280 [Candidatus Marinimicrobia bacterium]|nr:hypothetical protein [Candidatus Neomarinimicrobiota bacterium]|tara:strand:+ start:87834 stop:88658 length:825 start_codon:yes stop_codon:yes gene_type:complete
MNLWIITVNFGNTRATNSLIESLSFVENFNSIRVGIADNHSSNESYAKLKKIIKNSKLKVKVFPNKKNLYYWPAVKKVINNLKNEIGNYPDWIIVCNNDITFSNNNFFSELEKIDIKEYPIIGPNIINSKGKKLNPFMLNPLSKLEKIYWNLYFSSYPLSFAMSSIKKMLSFLIKTHHSKNLTNIKNVYAVHGSAILFSNYFFNKGGWLDSNFEMYAEELTVAEIAKKLNLPVTYYPKLEIIHHEHSTMITMNKRKIYYKQKESHKYFQSSYLK